MASPNSSAPTQDIGHADLTWGAFGQGLLTEWWETTADLIWPQSVITYGRMRHDPQIKSVLSACRLPILRATWQVDGEGCRDEVTQQVADDLGLPILGTDSRPGPARRRGVVWHRHVRSALQSLVFGHMIFERRYRIEGQRLRLDNLGERMPWTVAQIRLDPQTALISELVQTTQREPIPASHLAWYAHEPEGANWAGISLLRACFGAWLLKHETWRVHATSIRRFGMGVPTVEAPAGATQGQVQQARDLASQMRVGDQSGAGLPTGFKFALQGMVGSVPDALGFIRYLDQEIAKSALAQLVELGQTQTGSRSLGETFLDLFLLSLQALADDLSESATSGQAGCPGIVTDLVDQNWGEDEPAPRVVCTDVGDDYEVTANAIQILVQSGAIIADDTLDEALRKRWGLPLRDLVAEAKKAADAQAQALALAQAHKPPAPVPEPGQPAGQEPAPGAGAKPPEPPPVKAAGPPFHRQLSKIEAAAGHDPEAVHNDWATELGGLLSSYKASVLADWKVSLTDQVEAAVKAGKTDRLAKLSVATADGATLVSAAMVRMANQAAQRMIAEAATQGVTIDLAQVKIPQARLGATAMARVTLAGSYLAQAASAKALQVTASVDVGGMVAQALDGMSDTSLRDQLGAALTAAQNAGRVAVLEAAPASAGTATYVATEIEDTNTCNPCRIIDGATFPDLAVATAAYPAGGYLECQGLARCRGTIMAVWGQ